jgi:hypothetical protein
VLDDSRQQEPGEQVRALCGAESVMAASAGDGAVQGIDGGVQRTIEGEARCPVWPTLRGERMIDGVLGWTDQACNPGKSAFTYFDGLFCCAMSLERPSPLDRG